MMVTELERLRLICDNRRRGLCGCGRARVGHYCAECQKKKNAHAARAWPLKLAGWKRSGSCLRCGGVRKVGFTKCERCLASKREQKRRAKKS